MIEQQLENLGFTDKEAQVYLALLQKGRATPTELSQITGINRTTVYSVSKELVRRGVILHDLGIKKQQLLALPPRELSRLAESEERQLEDKRRLINLTVAELERLTKQVHYSVPKITFIEEEEIENYLYRRTPEWNQSLLEVDSTWWGFQDDTFVGSYGEWISWYWEEGTQPGIDLKLLSTETDIERQMQSKGYANRQIKYWADLKIDATTWVNGDYLVMIVTNQRPHYLVEIHDATLARNQRGVFKRIWETVQKV